MRTAGLFRPLHRELVDLLRSLTDEDWSRPTVAGQWTVKDVAAHMLDGQLRRLSFHRDGQPMPSPSSPIESPGDLVVFLDHLNAEWVHAFRRVGHVPLVALLEVAGPALASFFESLEPLAPAFFAVDWAGESESLNWMDMGRDFTELWHHQAQIRLAVDAKPLIEDVWMTPLYELCVRALPRSLSHVEAELGTSARIEIDGPGAGSWALRNEESGWLFVEESPAAANATVRMDGATAWQIFFNAVGGHAALALVDVEGERMLWDRVLRTRSVMVPEV